MRGRVRSARQVGKRELATVVVAGLAAGLALAEIASARPQALTVPSECIETVNGAPWHYKGQHGTAYTVLGVNGASCATGAKRVPSWTRGGGDLKLVPAGWHCSATLAGSSASARRARAASSNGAQSARRNRPTETPSNRRPNRKETP